MARLKKGWTAEEDARLKVLFATADADVLENEFDRSINAIKGRAYRLGLKKDWGFVQKIHKRNAQRRWKRS
ncbi:MAG: hypothetical protein ACMXYM_02915 [Candidatus Woesearchaeota archaeon]